MITPIAVPKIDDSRASSIVTGSADKISSETGFPLVTDTPKLPVSTLPSQDRNCTGSGWSRP